MGGGVNKKVIKAFGNALSFSDVISNSDDDDMTLQICRFLFSDFLTMYRAL